MIKKYVSEDFEYNFDLSKSEGFITQSGEVITYVYLEVARKINALLRIQEKLEKDEEKISKIWKDKQYGRETEDYPYLLKFRTMSDCHSTANYIVLGKNFGACPYINGLLYQGVESTVANIEDLIQGGVMKPILIRSNAFFTHNDDSHHSQILLGHGKTNNIEDLIFFGTIFKLMKLENYRF